MSDYHRELDLVNARLHVIEHHLIEINKTLADIRDAVLMIGGSLPAPMREDASGSSESQGDTRALRGTLSRKPHPVLRVAEGPEGERPSERVMRMVNCDHEWPPELTPDSQCPKCGMTYKHWSAAINR